MTTNTRTDLVADQLAHLPYGSRAFATDQPPVRIGATGSGESLLVLAWSAQDLAREKTMGARVLQRLGIRPGMRIANTLAGALVTPGSLLLGDVLEEIGALDIPLGATDSDGGAKGALDLYDRVEPAIVVVDQTTAPRFFAATAAERARPWWQGIVWLRRGTEAWRPPAAPAGFGGWQRTWLAVPEVTSFVGGTCDAGHLHVDHAIEPTIEHGMLALRLDGRPDRYASGIEAKIVACACGVPGPALAV